MNSIKMAFSIFEKKQRWKLVWMVWVILLGSICELIGITAILPFITVVLNEESINQNPLLGNLSQLLNLKSTVGLMIVLGILLMIVYILKNIYMILMNNHIYRFAYSCQKDLAVRLLVSYLKQPYIYFSTHNSADFIRNLNNDTILFFESVIASLQLLAEALVCILLGITMVVLEPMLLFVGIVFIFVIFGYRYLKKCLELKGIACRSHRGELNKWVLQAIGGIKETKILGKEQFFIRKYGKVYKKFGEDYRKYKMYAFVPRPLMETIAVCTLLSIVLIKLSIGTNMARFIPVLSMFAVAIFRILPSFNRMTTNVSIIMFNRASVEAICRDLAETEKNNSKEFSDNQTDAIDFKEKIELQGISFVYPGGDENVIENANLLIPKGKSVAFIGPSGSGKTTLADIILGVLKQNTGEVLVDGVVINPMTSAWHSKLGYIPQNIFLMDDTIRNNIAFGIDKSEIKDSQVLEALEGAQLRDFVEELPEGLDTIIGEAGVRLSGGQRQRIGIARALYTNPEILVLDEATSALDNDTEKAVMEAIDNLAGTKTLLIIAHRLTTIKNCDIVYEIKNKHVGEKKNG